ncbi:hypothetical protein AX15_002363 [Amanita polypyramis BW_CC]|nr:hypothetical protein AX15_002363 [Amanita polypyramis BW_CC]
MSSDDHTFLFASLQSKRPFTARKVHIRRLYDLLQLCIHRQDFVRARRAWAILARCKEVQWRTLWTTSLLLVGTGLHGVDSGEEKVHYLRALMLQHLDDREAILTEVIHCLIRSGRYKEALDELELYLPSFPYQDNPILHAYAGLLSLYLSQEASKDPSRCSAFRREAQSHFGHAIELDADNFVAQAFIQKTLANNYESLHADSDQEEFMEVDDELTPKPKRTRV